VLAADGVFGVGELGETVLLGELDLKRGRSPVATEIERASRVCACV
jgi:hypothetical protein